MTTPFWCLFILIFLPYILSSIGGYIRIKTFGGYDNKQPRAQAAMLDGLGARAYAAQQNLWESLTVFSIAVFVAHFAGANPDQASTAAIVFVVMRITHATAYLLNQDKIRTLSFTAGYACCIWLFALAIQAQ